MQQAVGILQEAVWFPALLLNYMLPRNMQTSPLDLSHSYKLHDPLSPVMQCLLCMTCSLGNITHLVWKHSLAVFFLHWWNLQYKLLFSRSGVGIPKGCATTAACLLCLPTATELAPTQNKWSQGTGTNVCTSSWAAEENSKSSHVLPPPFFFRDEKFSI